MVFAWDEKKNRINRRKHPAKTSGENIRRKHGVSFETAARIFEDPNVVSYRDRVVDEGALARDRLRRRHRNPISGSYKRGTTWRRRNPHHLGKKGESQRPRSLLLLSLTSSAGNSSGSRTVPIRRSTFPMRLKEGRGRPALRWGAFTGQSSNW
jgi:uncharacterized DUF497 family protein